MKLVRVKSWGSASPGHLSLLFSGPSSAWACLYHVIPPSPEPLYSQLLSSQVSLYLFLLFPCRSAVWAGEVLGLLEIFQSQKFGHWPQTSRIPRQIPTSWRLPSGCEWISLVFPTLIVLERKLDQTSGYLDFDPSCATSSGTLPAPIWALVSLLNRVWEVGQWRLIGGCMVAPSSLSHGGCG